MTRDRIARMNVSTLDLYNCCSMQNVIANVIFNLCDHIGYDMQKD